MGAFHDERRVYVWGWIHMHRTAKFSPSPYPPPPAFDCSRPPLPTGVDGIVKFWDLRQAAGGATAAAAPAWDLARLCDASVPHISQKQHGITSLALQPQGGVGGGNVCVGVGV